MKQFGLIGYPLSHSFSKKYFTEKFKHLGISDCKYDLYPLENIKEFPNLIQRLPNLRGLNVTIPYKELILPYLDNIEVSAAKVGAVNTIDIKDGKLSGYNTDVFGFEQSLRNFILKKEIGNINNALILGTGGASKAIAYVLDKLGISYTLVSRSAKKEAVTYHELDEKFLMNIQLIVNTTPLGMSPNIDSYPAIPYEWINGDYLLFDLVYNPEKTVFLKKGEEKGASILNGHEMLIGQAEKSWEIWNDIL